MANKKLSWEENVKGPYYVDDNCIAAKFCVGVAPRSFRMSEDGHAYIYKQPETLEEEQCRKALEGCPVNAVSDDGGGYP